MWIPNVAQHGVWVKLRSTKQYGRISHMDWEGPLDFDEQTGEFYKPWKEPSAWVIWENASTKAKFEQSADCVTISDLIILPVEPEPWWEPEREAWLRAKKWTKHE